MSDMLLLRAPSRRSGDVAISFRAPMGDATVADLLEDMALGASCPPSKAVLVRSCILNSGRYDCRVSRSAMQPRYVDDMRELLAEVGGRLLLLADDGSEIPEDIH